MEKAELIRIKEYLVQHKIEDEEWFTLKFMNYKIPFEEWSYEDMVYRVEHTFFNIDLGCCECYMPDDVREAILDVLVMCYDRTADNFQRRVDLLHDNPYSQFMFYVLNDKGYLEHGSSIGSSWTTDKGKMYMDVLFAYFAIEDYDGTFA